MLSLASRTSTVMLVSSGISCREVNLAQAESSALISGLVHVPSERNLSITIPASSIYHPSSSTYWSVKNENLTRTSLPARCEMSPLTLLNVWFELEVPQPFATEEPSKIPIP